MLEGSGQPGGGDVGLAHLRPNRLFVLRERHRRRTDVMVAGEDVAGSHPPRIGDQVAERLAEVVTRLGPGHPADGLGPALLHQALDRRGDRLIGQAQGRRPVLGRQRRLEVDVLEEEIRQPRHGESRILGAGRCQREELRGGGWWWWLYGHRQRAASGRLSQSNLCSAEFLAGSNQALSARRAPKYRSTVSPCRSSSARASGSNRRKYQSSAGLRE